MTTHSKPKTNDAALASFVRGKAEIDDLLARIQAASADHFGTAPDAVTWDHAGSLGFVTEPSVPMMMRHLPPESLDLKARKDHLSHAHAPETDRCSGW